MATGSFLTQGYNTLQDNSGLIVPGGLVWTYQTGTTTPQTTYSDAALTTPNANPIVCDSAGRWIAYVPNGSLFKLVMETAATPPAHGATIRTVDPVAAPPVPPWTLNAYNAANFTGLGGGTWTVDAGDQTAYQYLVDGKKLFLKIQLSQTSIAGVVNQIQIALPAGITLAAFQQLGPNCMIFDNSATAASAAFIVATAGATIFSIVRYDRANLTINANNTYVYVDVCFAIA